MNYKNLITLVILITSGCRYARCAHLVFSEIKTSSSPSDTESYYHNENDYVLSKYSEEKDTQEKIANSSSSSSLPSSSSTTEVLQLSSGRHARRMRQNVQGGGQGKRRREKGGGLMSRILPLMVMPFLVSSSLIPMMLTSLKFMLMKSLFVGKVAIFLLALNALWKSNNRGGVYSHNVNIDNPEQKDLHMKHYGWNGDEEYGAYVNRRMGKSLASR